MQKILSRIVSFFSFSESSQKWVPLILVILLAAFLIRVGFFLYFFENNQSFFYDGDSRGYTGPALNMSLGNGFSTSIEAPYQAESFRTPGYSFFLFLHVVFLGGLIPALFTQVILSLFIAFLVLKIADQYFKIEWGVIASAFFLFSPFSVLTSIQFTPVVLFSALLAMAAWSVLTYVKTNSYSFLYVASVIFTIMAYVRPIALLILFPLFSAFFIAWVWKKIPFRRFAVTAFVLLVVFVAGLSPWFFRNYFTSGYFSFSSLPTYQLYFFEDVAFHAVANKQSFAQSRMFFENHISEVTGKDYAIYRRQYIEFSALTPKLSEEALRFAGAYPFAVIEARTQQFIDFFLRDGIRYWFERFDAHASKIKGAALQLYEKESYPEHQSLIFFENVLNGIIALGFFVTLVRGDIHKNIAVLALGFLVLYFAFLSGVASSASYRYQAEPLLTLLGVIGLCEMWSLLRNWSSKNSLQSSS